MADSSGTRDKLMAQIDNALRTEWLKGFASAFGRLSRVQDWAHGTGFELADLRRWIDAEVKSAEDDMERGAR